MSYIHYDPRAAARRMPPAKPATVVSEARRRLVERETTPALWREFVRLLEVNDHAEKVEIQAKKCSCCGGYLPDEGSQAWEESEGTCPGSTNPNGLCGAFNPSLRTRVEERAS